MAAAVKFVHAGKKYSDRRILDGFDLEVEPGEAVSLSGPDGCGKSTVIRLALGLVLATSGTVFVGGINPAKAGYLGRIRMRRRISAVLDEPVLPAMPAEAWLAAGIWSLGEAWSASLKRARGILEETGMAGDAGKPFGALNPASQTVISLAGALARRPAVLLIDRAGLRDMEIPGGLASGMSSFTRQGGACLVAGAPPSWFAAFKSRVIKMEKGTGV